MSTLQCVRWSTVQAASAPSRHTGAKISRYGLPKAVAPTRSTAAGSRRPFGTSPAHSAKLESKGPARKSSPASKSQKHDNRQTLNELLAERKMPLVAAGLAAMVIGAYITMLVISAVRGPQDGATDDDNCIPTGRPLDVRQGRVTAMVFDQELNASEGRIGIKGFRKMMGGLARGHVLEVAVGTGRNVHFIDWDEIKATAPPVAGEDDTLGNEVKRESDLERERIERRMQKRQKGMVLPGDEAPEVLSYTGVDVSTDVLEVAWGKLRQAVPELIPRRRRQSPEGGQQETAAQPQPARTTTSTAVSNPQPDTPDFVLAANIGHGRIRLYKADATQQLPPPPALTSHDSSHIQPAPPYYDTILQNFGLCSVGSPHRLLATMAGALRPGSGRIYLLEHGRGSYGWLNTLLDKFAPGHFRKYGCWWNRDIEELVREAEKEVPGLEIVRFERPLWLQGGTMLWIELRVVNPNKRA